jgi:hypothetical protein
MKTQKQDVVVFLLNQPERDSEKFNKAFELYRNSPGKNFSQERFLNKGGFTPTNLATVVYELKKLHKISDSELKKAVKEMEASGTPVQKTIADLITILLQLPEEDKNSILFSYKINSEIKTEEKPLSVKLEEITLDGQRRLEQFLKDNEEEFPWINDNEEAAHELIEALDKLTGEIKFPESIKAEIELFTAADIQVKEQEVVTTSLNEVKEKTEVHRDGGIAVEGTSQIGKELFDFTKAIETATPEVKEAIKFRDEFPFLKDENCPEELKVLVTDKFNAYYAFCDAHKELLEKVVLPAEGEKLGDSAEIFALAKKAVENFLADQAIYNELAYYKNEKKILGKHPVFAKRKLQEEVNKLSIAEAAKRASNLDNYIRRDTNKAENAQTDEDKQKFLQKVDNWKLELEYIKRKLDK